MKKGNTLVCEMTYSSADDSKAKTQGFQSQVFLALSAVNISVHCSSCMIAEGFVLQPWGAAIAHRELPPGHVRHSWKQALNIQQWQVSNPRL